MKKILAVLLFLFLVGCSGEDLKYKSYSREQLENNPENRLKLPSEEHPNIQGLVQKLSDMDREAIEKFLQKKGLNIFEASYGLHFLGNRYFSENQFRKGMFYQELAANQYMNPYAFLRLALIYSKSKEEIQNSLPNTEASDFDQNFEKSFFHLHSALNIAIMTMDYFNDRTVLDDINLFGNPLIELFERKDSLVLGDFDIKTAENSAKERIPQIESAFLKVYNPQLKDK